MKPLRLSFLLVALVILVISCDSTVKTKTEDAAPPAKETVAVKKKTKSSPAPHSTKVAAPSGMKGRLEGAKEFVEKNGYSTEYCFLIDMGIKSGKNRFFVYNLESN